MANEYLTARLSELVEKVGGVRKASLRIEENTGAAPSKSAIDRALKGSCSDYNVMCFIRDLEEAAGMWFMYELHTFAWDGHYRNKKEAEYLAGFKETIWKGSKWVVLDSSKFFLGEDLFHTKPEPKSRLQNAFGEPDYQAGDKYDAKHKQ